MDISIIIALISASATILAAIIGPLIHWWLEIRTREETDTAQPLIKRWFFIIISVIGGGTLITIIGLYLSLTKYSDITPDLSFVWAQTTQSNAVNNNYLATNPSIPKKMSWYELNSNGIISSSAPQINYSKIIKFLYYESRLEPNRDSWTGLFFWRRYPLPSYNASSKTEFIAIIEAKEQDVLEIGIKDRHGNENKVALKVIKGWAGYRIAFDKFGFFDPNKIELFLIAHTKAVRSNDTNAFHIALLGFN